MSKKQGSFHFATQSKFVRSVFLRVLAVFLIVSIAIVAIVFYSFSSEINRSLIADRRRQLAAIEDTISSRMEEITSIAYNIEKDPSFYLEPVDGVKYSGYEMSNTLARYLVGNSFIEYLAYYRLSEPDKLYISKGELSFSDFWTSYLGLSKEAGDAIIAGITSTKEATVVSMEFGDGKPSFFAYTCPLPQFSENPQAFVLMMIPMSELEPLWQSQLGSAPGEICVLDAEGNEIFKKCTLDEDIPFELGGSGDGSEEYLTVNGERYVMQQQTSDSNGWTYVSIIRLSDMVSGLANKQVLFILLLLVLMFVAVFVLFIIIVGQYRPISELAKQVNDNSNKKGQVVDEGVLLSHTFAALSDDSQQKQKFETAYYEADVANKAKSAFLSSMSHDIRTPMNAIIGMTSIALKHPDEPDYVRECLQKVQVASGYLLDIINNVLDMSRIETGKFTLSHEEIDLPRLVYGIMTILAQSVEAKHQRFIVEVENITDEKVIGDNVRLMQVFMNILSNSVKFTPEGGEIGLHMCQNPDREYVFTFTDTGIGMTPEFVERVFDTFTRASDSNVTKVEGTGLGMAIAKNLVVLMGGTIRCESELGKGTTFTVTVKLPPADNGKPSAESFSGVRALILGGEEKICRNQASLFAEVGAEADYALTLDDAERLSRQAADGGKSYDLAVINQTDDDVSGISAAGRITAAVLVLAAKELEAVRKTEAEEAGIAAYCQAPLFRSTVVRLLKGDFEQDADEKTPEGTLNLEGLQVLLAEDNEMNREIARKIISETRAETVEAANGQEAVDIFSSSAPGWFDVILMDIQMPVMDGYQATAAIRALEREDCGIPIYAMTANTFDEDVRRVKEAGMNGHLGKPYTPDELYKILGQVTGG